MNKARGLVLIPYFGKLPNIFPFWVKTAALIRQIEWLILTDAKIPCELPQNVKVKKCLFADVQTRIRQNFPYAVKIDSPWGLCAFRPAYGEIFKEEFAGYEFWGYGDLDVLYGNLDKYLTDAAFDRYDKLFRWGHLSLIRNNEFGRTVYSRQLSDSRLNCRDAFNGGVACFDERMFNDLIEENGGTIDDGQPIADFHQREFLMRFFAPGPRTTPTAYRVLEPNNLGNIFLWNDEGLFRHFINQQGQVDCEEFAYIHFCRRPMRIENVTPSESGFAIVPNKLVPHPATCDVTFIRQNTRKKIYWAYILPRLKPAHLYKRFKDRRVVHPEK